MLGSGVWKVAGRRNEGSFVVSECDELSGSSEDCVRTRVPREFYSLVHSHHFAVQQ